eukprot:TRINITY_DN19787_c0_g1_i1.p1 TRINITY_DN19787_c0_g1~~TRINITY_DN19787_c0_g1_i1.p1  ORF type:complete len:413 (-),score=42.30 TRINITY_DN19787_c0_g1_i1:157-1395(-)
MRPLDTLPHPLLAIPEHVDVNLTASHALDAPSKDPDYGTVLTSVLSITMLIALAQIHMLAYSRDQPSAFIASLYVAYVSLHCATSFVIADVGQTSSSVTADAIQVVLTALVAKLVVASGMFLAEEVPKDTTRVSFRLQQLHNSRTTLLYTAIPALLYTVSDVLIVSCQERLTLSEVQIISKLSILITTFMWTVTFQTPVSAWKWAGLTAIVCGGATYFGGAYMFDDIHDFANHSALQQDVAQSHALYVWIFKYKYHVLLIGQVMLSCAAGIACEYLLRSKTGSVNLQNVAQYSWSLIFLLLSLLRAPRPSFEHYSFQMTVACALFAAIGVVTGYLLKYMGSVWKQAAYGNMVVLYFFVDYILRSADASIWHVFGVFITFVGTCAFVLDGWKPVNAVTGNGKLGTEDQIVDKK